MRQAEAGDFDAAILTFTKVFFTEQRSLKVLGKTHGYSVLKGKRPNVDSKLRLVDPVCC